MVAFLFVYYIFNIMKYLIIPDVHGRSFWETPVCDLLKEDDVKIIFLGDYLDPYPNEWKNDNYQIIALDNFNKILSLKKKYMDKIILLIGNHDAEYMYGKSVCNCRCDNINYDKIKTLFIDNKDLFKICHEEYINGKRYIFSHAGILEKWANEWFENYNAETFIDGLNEKFKDSMNDKEPESTEFCEALSVIDYKRGGWNTYGSLIWGDVRLFKPFLGYQIFGHTQLVKEFIHGEFACLDARKAFIIDENGNLNAIREK